MNGNITLRVYCSSTARCAASIGTSRQSLRFRNTCPERQPSCMCNTLTTSFKWSSHRGARIFLAAWLMFRTCKNIDKSTPSCIMVCSKLLYRERPLSNTSILAIKEYTRWRSRSLYFLARLYHYKVRSARFAR